MPPASPHTAQLSRGGCQRQQWGQVMGSGAPLCPKYSPSQSFVLPPKAHDSPLPSMWSKILSWVSRPFTPSPGPGAWRCSGTTRQCVDPPPPWCSSQVLGTHFSRISLRAISQAPRGLSCSLQTSACSAVASPLSVLHNLPSGYVLPRNLAWLPRQNHTSAPKR